MAVLLAVAIFASTMKKTLAYIWFCWAMSLGSMAQEIKDTLGCSLPDESPVVSLQPVDGFRSHRLLTADHLSVARDETSVSDTLHLPLLNHFGQPYTSVGIYPMRWGGWYDWQLHEGLNVSLDVSAFGFFGRHALSGTGFQQNITVMYAQPLSDKLSFAVGGYMNNVDWKRDSYTGVGISGMLSYRFNDRWEAYIYGHKSLKNNSFTPLPIYDMTLMGDCIGAAVKYNVTPSFYVELSVDKREFPSHSWYQGFSDPFRRPDSSPFQR